MIIPIGRYIKEMKNVLSVQEQASLLPLTLVVLVASVLELVGLSLVIPLVKIATDFESLTKYPLFENILDSLGGPDQQTVFVYALVVFVFFFTAKFLFVYYALYRQYSFVFGVRGQLSIRLYEKYLRSPWEFHISKNSGHLINILSNEVNVFTGAVLLPTIVILAESIVVSLMFIFLLLYAPEITLMIGGVMLVTLGLVIGLSRKKMARWGKSRQNFENMRIQQAQQGLHSVKQLSVMNRSSWFVNLYAPFSVGSAEAVKKINLLQILPRYMVEFSLILALAAVLLYSLTGIDESMDLLSVASIFVVASIRILPSITKISGALQSVRGNYQSLKKISSDLLDSTLAHREIAEPSNPEEIIFDSDIVYRDVSYCYPNSPKAALTGVNVTIKKNECIGIVGRSGSGKSTFVDILLGVLPPSHGSILVDGLDVNTNVLSWQSLVGFVPQSIYLCDDSIRNNILFGAEIVDEKLMNEAVKGAGLTELIEGLPMGLEENVGEHGVMLSGGQRQRIGIARALYHNPEVLVFDEATSALDAETEKEFIEAVAPLKNWKTIIVIAHRESALAICDRIINLEAGRLC